LEAVVNEDEERAAGNALGWYVAYRVVSPLFLAVELGRRLRLWWRS